MTTDLQQTAQRLCVLYLTGYVLAKRDAPLNIMLPVVQAMSDLADTHGVEPDAFSLLPEGDVVLTLHQNVYRFAPEDLAELVDAEIATLIPSAQTDTTLN